MQKTIGVTSLQRQFRTIFDEVARGNTPYILTRDSRPEAALIPYEEYLRFQRLQESDVLRRVDALLERMNEQNRRFSEEEVAADVEAALQEVRQNS